MSDLPKVVRTATIDLGEFKMRVHNLDNGMRVIDAEDVERFFTDPDTQITPEQADELAQALRATPNPEVE